MIANVYIMTDARGFTTCIEAGVNVSPMDNYAAMLREAGRVELLAPISVFYWRLHGDHRWPEWRLAQEFTWNGEAR